MLGLLRGKPAATFQCVYISTVLHNNVLIHCIDESPEFFLHNRRWHQLNISCTSISSISPMCQLLNTLEFLASVTTKAQFPHSVT